MDREAEIEAAWTIHNDWKTWRGRDELTREARDRLAEAQNWRCAWCGGRMDGTLREPDAPTFEHLIPRSKRGRDTIDNVVIAHRKCNQARGDAPISEWTGG